MTLYKGGRDVEEKPKGEDVTMKKSVLIENKVNKSGKKKETYNQDMKGEEATNGDTCVMRNYPQLIISRFMNCLTRQKEEKQHT